MILHKSHCYRPISTLCSSGDALLADRAILYLRRHPDQLTFLSSHFTPQASSNLLVKSQFDQSLVLKFLHWARSQRFFSFQCKCLALHILTRFKLYKTAQSLAEELANSSTDDTGGSELFRTLKDSYHLCNSSSAVTISILTILEETMSISTFFGCRIPAPPLLNSPARKPAPSSGGNLLIECSSRPTKKATAHHMKTRPRKSQPWDIRRKPTVYPPLPSLPPDWTLISSVSGDGDSEVASSISISSSEPVPE